MGIGHGHGHRDAEPSRGRNIAEEEIGESVSSLDAGLPCIENGLRFLVDLGERERTSAKDNGDDRLARGGDAVEKFLLMSGERQVGARRIFSVQPFGSPRAMMTTSAFSAARTASSG